MKGLSGLGVVLRGGGHCWVRYRLPPQAAKFGGSVVDQREQSLTIWSVQKYVLHKVAGGI